jgi:hypothetical protein
MVTNLLVQHLCLGKINIMSVTLSVSCRLARVTHYFGSLLYENNITDPVYDPHGSEYENPETVPGRSKLPSKKEANNLFHAMRELVYTLER